MARETEGAPVFGGARPPTLFAGLDVRLWLPIAVLLMGGAFASLGGLVPALVLWAAAGAVYLVGRHLGSVEPLLIDEIASAFVLRAFRPPVIPDDAHFTTREGRIVRPFWRRTKKR